MFPNLERLSFLSLTDFPGGNIWESFKKIKTLALWIDLDEIPIVDSTFIGITPEHCLQLLDSPSDIFDAAVQDRKLVTAPSIADLQSKF